MHQGNRVAVLVGELVGDVADQAGHSIQTCDSAGPAIPPSRELFLLFRKNGIPSNLCVENNRETMGTRTLFPFGLPFAFLAGRPRRTVLQPVRASSEDDWRQFRAALIMSERAEQGNNEVNQLGSALLSRNESVMAVSNPSLSGMELWAVPTTVVERGSVIVAASALSSAATLLQQHRQEAVIFITQHDSSGTRGLILNRPTNLTLGRTLIESSSGDAYLRQLFTDNVLYMGGIAIAESVFVLHTRPDIWKDSEEVISGIYSATGLVPEDLGARLESAGCTMSDRASTFKFYCGMWTWSTNVAGIDKS